MTPWGFVNKTKKPESQGIWRCSFLVRRHIPADNLHDPEIHRHKCSDFTLDVSKFGRLNWIQPTGDFGAGFSNGPESASGKYRLAWRAKKGTVAVLLCHGKCVFMGVRALVDPASISSDAMCRIPAWVFSGLAVCCRTSICVAVSAFQAAVGSSGV
ncbi:hypothetical protein [uncultured Hoeflea sp.]|uniref:hypothetical protein n=1 Tax=uncultured Hoeflea sp. TaxID=538666 RepID=UPI0030D739EF|tara:strand:+ start:1753 stop:2220 length:468 start_codon:yes stop_codon:yes gene_type:complete